VVIFHFVNAGLHRKPLFMLFTSFPRIHKLRINTKAQKQFIAYVNNKANDTLFHLNGVYFF
jgi:hypothetical protein